MKCLRCGHCCIAYEVVIIRDGSKPLDEDNIMLKPGGKRCPHLVGTAPGNYSCGIHNHPDYDQTPCADFTQVESSTDDVCRIGEYVLAGKKISSSTSSL